MASKEELLQKMSDYVFEMEDEEIADVCEEYIEAGYDPLDGILHGLVDGMNRASDMYDQEEYFVTDLLLCSDAMYAGLDVLRPHLPEDSSTGEQKKAVIGVVEGDTHDIGQNLVKIMMETAGFEMYDLGRDVPLDSFVEKAKEIDADLIMMSTLMTTTMPGMKEVIQKAELLGDALVQYRVIIYFSYVSDAQIIAGHLYSILLTAIQAKKGSCMPFMSPIDVRLDLDDRTMVQPDVIILCDKSKYTPRRIEGAPDFIAEVLSPSSKTRDLFIKLNKYRNAGVREYWVIDPIKKSVMTYVFENQDDYAYYTFRDHIPVSIYGDELVIDFSRIDDVVSEWM